MRLPEDLFILQTVDRSVYTADFIPPNPIDKIYEEVDQIYGKDGLVQLYIMLLSVRDLIDGLTDELDELLLPTSDDGRLYFSEYCLSLPRERLLAYIENPKEELTRNRIYYVNLNGDVYDREGYLWSYLEDFIDQRYPELGIQDNYDQYPSDEYLETYEDILHNIVVPFGGSLREDD